MAGKAANSAIEQFGTFAAAATISHYKLEYNGVDLTDIITLKNASGAARTVAIAANSPAQLSVGDLIFRIKKGMEGVNDNGIQRILQRAFTSSNPITVRLYTDSTTEVSVSGYSAQTVNAWTFSTEAD